MAEIRIPCPGCQAVLKLADTLAGKKIRCPKCKAVVPVPAAESEAAPDQPRASEPRRTKPAAPPHEPAEEARPRADSARKKRPAEDEEDPRADATDAPAKKRGRDEDQEDERPRPDRRRRREEEDERPARQNRPAARKRSPLLAVIGVVALLVVGTAVGVGLMVAGVFDTSGPNGDRPGPFAGGDKDRTGKDKDSTDKDKGPPPDPIGDLPARDEAEEKQRAEARDKQIQAFRMTELKLAEQWVKGADAQSKGLAIFTLNREGALTIGSGPTFARDGRTLATMVNQKVRFWDLRTGNKIRDFLGSDGHFKTIMFSPDGGTLIGAERQEVWFWDVQTGKSKSIEIAYSNSGRFALSPDGQKLAAGPEDPDRTVRVWDLTTGAELRKLSGQFGAVFASAFRPDGRVLATATFKLFLRKDQIQLWDVATGKPYGRAFDRTAHRIGFSPDGWTLAGTCLPVGVPKGDEKILRLFDLATGAQRELAHSGYVDSFAFSPDGKLLATGDGTHLRLWDVGTGRELGRHPMSETFSASGLAFSPGGALLVSEKGEFWLVSDLLDQGLGADFSEASKLGLVKRQGESFYLEARKDVTDAALADLKKVRRLAGLSLASAEKVTDAGLAHLKDLPDLRHLVLNGTMISDRGLAHLKGMTELTTLELHGTQVTRAGLAHVKGMKKLRTLDLGGCPIGDEGLADLAGLTELTSLDLTNTNVTDAGLVHVEGMTRLTKLSLYGNDEVKKDGLARLKGLKELRELDLRDTEVEDAGLEYIKGLTALTNLYLNGTPVTDRGLASIKGLTRLEQQLLPSGVTDAGLAHLAGLTNLFELDWPNGAPGVTGPGLAHLAGMKRITSWRNLAKTGVTDAGLEHLKGWTHVKELTLPRRIGDAGLKHLAPLVNLELLDLEKTRVTDAGLVHLYKLPKLATLDVTQTRVTKKGIAELKKALPDVEVVK